MRVLLDTNILIDFYTHRAGYYDSAEKIMTACAKKAIDGCIAAHSITNAFYILRKEISLAERRAIFKDLCTIVQVIGIDDRKLLNALENESFTDVEDCLQAECAREFGADYIVTRNVKDFAESSIPAITPGEFLRLAEGTQQ